MNMAENRSERSHAHGRRQLLGRGLVSAEITPDGGSALSNARLIWGRAISAHDGGKVVER